MLPDNQAKNEFMKIENSPHSAPQFPGRRLFDLVVYKVYADLRAEAAKTYINYLWWVLDPILTMLVFYIVFGVLFDRGGEGFVAFLLVGLVMWIWYKQSISNSANAILAGKGLMNQVYLPKLVFPVVTLLTVFTKFVFVLGLLLLFLWWFGKPVSVAYLALPLVLLIQFLLAAALALLLAGLVPYFPDLKMAVESILHLQFFLSGIFFSADSVPEKYQFWFFLNPMASLIHDYRSILLHGEWPHWVRLGTIAFVGAVVLLLAITFIHTHDREYPRIVR